MPPSSQDSGHYRFCANCGEPRYPGAAFCTECGAPLAARASAPSTIPDRTLVAESEPVPQLPAEESVTQGGDAEDPPAAWSGIPAATRWRVLGNPLQIGARVAPLDVWIVLTCAAVNVAIFGWWTIQALRGLFSALSDITGEYAALGFLLTLVLLIYAVVPGDPKARVTVSIIVSVASVLLLTADAGASAVGIGTWIQVGLGVTMLVLLWLVPASSHYLDPRQSATA